ncbi:hypothetical protein [Vagococcus sp.]|uniref:hypothetical protein n=1 Tax=Vagococcus sp. TaxID=1933889 RepID=UPI003F9C6D92
MRADQHKDNSSKKKKLLIYFLILIVVVAIAFIGIKSFDFSSPSNKSAKVTTKTDKKIAESSVKKKELDELAKAMDGVLSLYEGSDLKEFRSDITTEDVDKARKLVN